MNRQAVAKELVAVARELTAYGGMVNKRDLYRPNPENMQNVERVKVPDDVEDDIEVWRYEHGGVLFGVAFVGRAQKPTWRYRFRSERQMQDIIDRTVADLRTRKRKKNDRRQERRQFRHDLKVGTILYASWGYDQTNVDWYQVTESGEKSVVVREVASKIVKSDYGADYVVAVSGKFTGPPMKKIVRQGNRIRITSYSSASVWDGRPKYQTAFGHGH